MTSGPTETNHPYPYLRICWTDDATEIEERIEDLLWECGATGIETQDASTLIPSSQHCRIAHFETLQAVNEAHEVLRAQFPQVEINLAFIHDDAWRDAWKTYFKPTRCGDRLIVKPSWESFNATPQDIVLTIDPGAAFGTGTHETTQLILRLLDAHFSQTHASERILDVGCGSGILTIAALLLGAQHGWALDNDPLAITVTHENARLNHVENRIDTACLNSSTLSLPTTWPNTYDLVVANIELAVLEPLAKYLTPKLTPGGTLMLSGLLCGQDVAMHQAINRRVGNNSDHTLTHVQTLEHGEWIAMVYRSL